MLFVLCLLVAFASAQFKDKHSFSLWFHGDCNEAKKLCHLKATSQTITSSISPRDALNFHIKRHIGSHATTHLTYAQVGQTVTVVGNMSFGNHQSREHALFFTMKGTVSMNPHRTWGYSALSGKIHGGTGKYKNAEGIITSADAAEPTHSTLYALISGHVWGEDVEIEAAEQAQSNGLDFFIGFVTGLQAKIGDPAVCAKEANLVLTDFENGYAQIKEGIRHLNLHEVEAGIQIWSNGLNQMSSALRDCGVNQLADDVERISAELRSGASGLLRFLAQEVLNFIDHDVYHLYREAIKSYDEQRYADSGDFTGQIVGILLSKN